MFDFNIASEMACPELPEAWGDADVQIRFGATPERLPQAVRSGLCLAAAPGEALLSLPGIGRFHVRDGAEIMIEPAAGIAQGHLRVFLLNLVFGLLLLQRGELVLHAAVVETDDGCIALAGESGTGKSTLAAALHARGRRVLSDEFCVVRNIPGQGPSVVPGPPYLQVWADALSQLGYDPARLEPVRPGLAKHVLPLGSGHADRVLPLRGIHILSPWNGAGAESEALSGPDRMEACICNTYRSECLRPMGLAAAHFAQALKLAGEVPFLRLRTPGYWGAMDQILELLPARPGRSQHPTTSSRTIE
ncbi:hypothetical protein D0B54_11665 [Solimonas sp. K1W22B-7]|nr:hypothetical protein D0B54_11665 [Solimonas sp. K1W22B-7]